MIFHMTGFSFFCRNGHEAIHVEGKNFGDKKLVVCVCMFIREMREVNPFDASFYYIIGSAKGQRKNSPEF